MNLLYLYGIVMEHCNAMPFRHFRRILCTTVAQCAALCNAQNCPAHSMTSLQLLRRTLPRLRPSCATPNPPSLPPRRLQHTPADSPGFRSIVDSPSILVRTGRRVGPGIILLAAIPIIAFGLGSWQIKRLDWKTRLIAVSEDRLVLEPLPLPPRIDPSVIPEFDYRRVTAEGRWRHDREMLVGPRIRDGQNGYTVITPLEREGGATVLVNRGWIAKTMMDPEVRRRNGALEEGVVKVEGLLRVPTKKNMFTPDNKPETKEFFFTDVDQMAELTGAQPVLIEATEKQDLIRFYEKETLGLPIARAAEVGLRNNHVQYIVTW